MYPRLDVYEAKREGPTINDDARLNVLPRSWGALERDNSPLAELVRQWFYFVDKLESLFGRAHKRSILDGNVLGKLSAAHAYGLELIHPRGDGVDAISVDGRRVVILVAYDHTVISLRNSPEHLIVLQIERDRRITELYNGPGAIVWEAAGNLRKNGQKPIPVVRLRKVQLVVSSRDRLLQQRAFPTMRAHSEIAGSLDRFERAVGGASAD